MEIENHQIRKSENSSSDFDSPWKEILDPYFQEFIAFFFPEVHKGIDWDFGYETLDKELQKVVRDAEIGKRLADKLMRVFLTDGREAWLLIHIEIQGHVDPDFSERMFIYNYRIFDRYRKKVVSLALLTDENMRWRPNRYGFEMFGFRLGMDFPVIKLLDYRKREKELESIGNPFALIVLAHLKTLETKKDQEERLRWKVSLTKRLYRGGFSRQNILDLFRFIDWIMMLPEVLDRRFQEAVYSYEEEIQMPYLSSIERMGIEKGVRQGLQQGLQQGVQEGLQQGVRQGTIQTLRKNLEDIIEIRFEAIPSSIMKKIQNIEDPSILGILVRKAVKTESIDAFNEILKTCAEE